MRSFTLIALLVAGCSEPELRTAIKIRLTGDVATIQSSADRIDVVVDPAQPFTDAAGDPLP